MADEPIKLADALDGKHGPDVQDKAEQAMIDAALKEGDMEGPTKASPGFEVVTPKEEALRMARRPPRGPIAVELRFPIGQWQKPEDMIGHMARLEADGAPFGEYLAREVDDRGRIVLQPIHLDGDYEWSEP